MKFKFLITTVIYLCSCLFYFGSIAQKAYTIDDTLRGSITPERAWWDLKYYALKVEVMPKEKFLKGVNTVKYKKIKEGDILQIDLQIPMEMTGV